MAYENSKSQGLKSRLQPLSGKHIFGKTKKKKGVKLSHHPPPTPPRINHFRFKMLPVLIFFKNNILRFIRRTANIYQCQNLKVTNLTNVTKLRLELGDFH